MTKTVKSWLLNSRRFQAPFRGLKPFTAAAGVAVLTLAGLPSIGLGQSTWNGSTSTDWNTAANWSSGVPSGVNAQINIIPANICTLTANISANPVDILVGDGAGVAGRIDHRAGLLQTGVTNTTGNWFVVGRNT